MLSRYETPRLTMRYCLVGLSDKCILQRPLASILQRPVWNTQTYNEILLGGPVGQMHFLVTTGFHPPETSGELLFSGQLDGSILVWKFNNGENSFKSREVDPEIIHQGKKSDKLKITKDKPNKH